MKKTRLQIVFACMAIVGFISITSLLTSCKKNDDAPAASVKLSLYDSLGGTTLKSDPNNSGTMIETGKFNLRSVVDSTILVIAADNSLNSKFFSVLLSEVTAGNTTGFSELSSSLTDFFSSVTGSKTIKYKGMDMVSAHDPAKNSRMGTKAAAADFDKFLGDLAVGAKKNGVSDDMVNNHIAPLVNTLRGAIVQK